MECNDDTDATILLRIKSNIVFSYTLHHAGSGNGALRCTGGATGPGTWQDGQEDHHSRRIFRSGSTTTSPTCPYMPDGTHWRWSTASSTHCRPVCRLLSDTAMSIAEVARMSGFSSASYFINVFRRRRGVTPRVWRESRCANRVTVRGSCHCARGARTVT